MHVKPPNPPQRKTETAGGHTAGLVWVTTQRSSVMVRRWGTVILGGMGWLSLYSQVLLLCLGVPPTPLHDV